MSHSEHFIPEEEGFVPAAAGLSDEDIIQLLAIIRTVTNEKILEIHSVQNDAEVRTGFLADGESGSGHHFKCVRDGCGWSLKDTISWIA